MPTSCWGACGRAMRAARYRSTCRWPSRRWTPKLPHPPGFPAREAAAGLIRIVEQNLLRTVERISIQRGYNPGRFMLIACGGAGPMHGASVGRKLGARAVYIPRQAGAFCAIGMQHADVRRDFVHVVMRELNDDAIPAIAEAMTA